MITNYKLFEIADSVVKPHIMQSFFSINHSFFTIQIKDNIYRVDIQCQGGIDNTNVKIDFGTENDGEYSDEMTNEGDALYVLSNIVGLVKEYFKNDTEQSYSGQMVKFSDITVVGFIIGAKGEDVDDSRRKRIYDYYIKKNFNKLGIQIVNVIDITDAYEEENGNRLYTKYEITPIKIKEIRENL